MLIDTFVKEMAARYPYSLKTSVQLEAYASDAQLILKNFQGEILKYAFNIIREDFTRLPKIPEVKGICLKVRLDQQPEAKKAKLEVTDAAGMIDGFMRAPMGQECIRRKIANQAKDFIEENHKLPTEKNCNHFLRVQSETDRLVGELTKSSGFGALGGLSKSVVTIASVFKMREDELRQRYF